MRFSRAALRAAVLLGSLLVVAAVEAQAPASTPAAKMTANASSAAAASHWAIALHGGAGTIPKDMAPALVTAYRASLRHGLEIGKDILEHGGTSLDAVQAVVRTFEDDSLFNAGVGAVYTHDGTHELDAAIMDGSTLACGSVAGIKTVHNPIVLARLVMEKSPHVFLIGEGAEAFARSQGLPAVDNHVFDTRLRWQQWQKALKDDKFGTVGCVALDRMATWRLRPRPAG